MGYVGLGLDWDEGPEVGGPHGPYFQSERQSIYQEYIEKLTQTGRTYQKDGALYFKVSGEPQLINDAIRGKVKRLEEKDFVIVRSNGTPVYHLACVIDDITMKISHIIRGEDHLSNTSKHIELFKAFGAPLPTFAHIPLILKSSGAGKMSKRDEGVFIEEYQKRHFLPEALRNYMCLLGWSPKEDREILPIEEIITLFDLPNINKNNARFDEKKLAYINTEYLRNLPLETFSQLAKPLLADIEQTAYLKEVLSICQEKIRSLEHLPEFIPYFFTEDFPYDTKAKEKLFKKGSPLTRIREIQFALKKIKSFDLESLEALVHTLAEEHGVQTGDYIHATRFAVSGTGVGPGFYQLLKVLGKTRVLKRLEKFLEMYA